MIHNDVKTKAQFIEELQGLRRRVAELEAALQKSERTLTDIRRLACMGNWVWDIRTGEVEWSEEVYRIFGLDRKTFHPEIDSVMNRFHPDDRKIHETVMAQAIANHQQYTFEARILMPDSSIRYVISTSEGDYDDNRSLTRISGIVQDITERRQAEAVLKEYQMAVEGSKDMIAVVDESYTYQIANQAFLSYRKMSKKQVIGHTVAEVLGKEAFEKTVKPNLERCFQGESIQYEMSYEYPQTGVRYLLVSYYPVTINHEKITRVVAVIRDITERKRAEEELRKYREQLEELVNQRTAELQAKNQELETFAYSVSHDLKAPLRGIDGYSRLLLEDYLDRLDEEGRMFLHNIRHATKQMNQLIEDLLVYSRLERHAFKPGQVNPRRLVEELIAERANEISQYHVALTVNIPFDSMIADSPSLTQVLRNLLDNALKFTHNISEPHIEIGGRETDEICLLWVRDNGIGFDIQYHDRIFDIFQRLHRIEDYPGTGIGLAIVRKALQRMGGRAWAKSKPDAGATFYVEFRRKPVRSNGS